MGKECPVCGLFSPGIAGRCDCGWDFARERIERSYARPHDLEQATNSGLTLAQVGARNIKRGARLIATTIVGLIITGIFLLRQDEPSPIILYGLYLVVANIAAGCLLIVRGLRQRAEGLARA